MPKMQSGKIRSSVRCGHYEQVKLRGKWKCILCGRTLTIPESMQNSIELSEVIGSSIESRRPLVEILDDMLGREEWEEILSKIPYGERKATRKCKRNLR